MTPDTAIDPTLLPAGSTTVSTLPDLPAPYLLWRYRTGLLTLGTISAFSISHTGISGVLIETVL